ncbi:CHAP domain-containing protein [Rhodovarius crocodyli]|uniref:CHAP domain-containing protein n=2 Tax=Rhodovarius crocodyli TaxID=1979269 RepID=A0A437MK15_9PROT|nr:CHAP domain-containing protein [Rhodovarius crocodyli]
MVTGMDVRGNGRDWWHNAAGRYARSRRPEVGSVLAFPSSGGMSAGHVAMVSRVLNNRHILIDHANWGGPGIRRGSVMQNVSVIDVSDDNSWTQVRVQVGYDPSQHGRAYPTYGFIHNRPDGGEGPAYASLEDGFRRVSYTRPVSHGRASTQRHGTARSAAQSHRQPQASRQAGRVQNVAQRRSR